MPTDEKIKILVVDDRPENLMAIEGVLERPELSIITATSGNEALGLVLEHTFALILLDVQMPGMDGFEVAELMRGSEKTRHIPIIFLTAISKEETHVFAGYEKGAVDYLFKPLDPLILRSKVNVFVELFRQRKNLQQRNVELSAAVAELEAVNRQIQEQQKSVIEEERLKVLLQMAGATAHELNQPLMSLLGNIDLIRMTEKDPARLMLRLDNIEAAGQRMADIIQRIQTIGSDEVIPYPGGSSIINFDQALELLFAGDSDSDFNMLLSLLQDQARVRLTRARSTADGLRAVEQARVDIVILGASLGDGDSLDFLAGMDSAGVNKPVLALIGPGDEILAARMVAYGAYDLLPRAGLEQPLLLQSIATTLQKFRLRFASA